MTQCDFCEASLTDAEPQNVALLQHLDRKDDCREQFEYMISNLNSSWTASMSGGA